MTIDAGTYEVLRGRLDAKARELAGRAETLNARRIEAFGAQQTELLGTERIRTGNNAVPADVAPAGEVLLFGANAFLGMKAETAVDDVFTVVDRKFQPAAAPGLLDDPGFRRDFAELYRYYRGTRLRQLRRVEGQLLAIFQTGARAGDLKVLRWQIGVDGTVAYQDARGERDHVLPPTHDFEWTVTSREQHVLGRHPHVSIEDEVFVETVGGDLTVKVEDNTEDGAGVYSEPVDQPLQSLADAEIAYARVGPLILLRVLPYQETAYRYLVFNTRTRDVRRLDGIGQACRRLPEDQGVIFPGGYYLVTGAAKTFDRDTAGLAFERVVRSVNGEDVLHVFHDADSGRYLLLPYNVIGKQVATPITGHGYAIFDDGTLVVLRSPGDEPARVHPVQVWRTPYVSDAHAAAQPAGTGPLARIGNADLVRGIADALTVSRMVGEMSAAGPVFEAIIAACTRTFDTYHWLADPELENLAEPLAEVRAAATRVLDEFAAVQALTAQAEQAVAEAEATAGSLVRRAAAEPPATTGGWVGRLAELRRERGRLAGLREMRYADGARLDAIDASLVTATDDTARRAVEFLRHPDAFADYQASVEELAGQAAAIGTVAEGEPVAGRITEQSDGLQVVTEVVGGLEIADATVRVSILDRIGAVLGGLNRARATVDARRRELAAVEGRAAFAAEFALFGQSVSAALAAADTPEHCDEHLARLMAQVETLESRFGEVDDFGERLATRRAEVYEAIAGRRQSLLDERARRADRLAGSARRILDAIHRRIATLGDPDEVNTYFATDPMVAKVRSVADRLRADGDPVRAEELDGRLTAARQEAGRALRDRRELFGDGGIRLGRHTFAVNGQAIDLTLVPHDGGLAYAITGTDYRAPVTDEAFQQTRDFWDQPLISEYRRLYRAEHLAAAILAEEPRAAATAQAEGRLRELVHRIADSRYDEGYERGVHDADATVILDALLRMHTTAGLLRYPPRIRVAAQLFWAYGATAGQRQAWQLRAASLIRVRAMFGSAGRALDDLRAELTDAATDHLGTAGLSAAGVATGDAEIGEYLVDELAGTPAGFVTGAGARAFLDRFHRELGGAESAPARQYAEDLRALAGEPAVRHQLVYAWLEAFHRARPDSGDLNDMLEAVGIEVVGTGLTRYDVAATVRETVTGLLGVHPRIKDGQLTVRLDALLSRARHFREKRMPAYRDYQSRRAALAKAERARLRLDEFKPRVMTTFVRNRLLDDVYLPLIGDNLARQLGTAGAERRTDRSGLLMLISPPGYGKTTLMEYVADRLGLVFVKVNGPALGHGVTSLDPADAPDATARQEVEKISLALEMGTNVLLHLDDIQHTSPELLQKFISLCDAQRRMEGVWNGRTRTYDLRGKRFAVCMAGNPYTESGRRFRVPDMLANRADVWNLGDVLAGREDLFALSYLENALTANTVLAPLAARDGADLPLLLRLAEGDETARADRLAYPYSAAELEQILAVLRMMRRAQRVVLRVNQAYLASASQAEAGRTEPPFRLQGSYRNMNKLAERIVPAMNDDELEQVIDDYYLGEAQTLTGGAEANLLKLAELRGRLAPARAARWAEVKAAYRREQTLGGAEADPVTRAAGAVALVADRVAGVEEAIRLRTRAAAWTAERPDRPAR
ncbi:DNA repair ATPase [Actinoplanes sp. SE50]|uniref:DNA repair ATPase n=1 Tax=unclassified Actinoplanes TaxID=2626549 RepID=UPI00023ECDF6|nr:MULTISPECIES: DNA repair ATPase [unclassified Actinoplanes]AEV82110.1 Chromosome partition protein smc [Actinoplanes sp. SE50/110]ATO80509.1 DNA repair ATPase [Actinoplanes sp. SE50]SLL97915.1 DNA repair ATPase [Actinoplanes sp. SE50/110]